MQRCPWATGGLSTPYHDEEWGVPVHDDRTLFEFLILEGAQAGLSWDTILKKREGYRAAFDGFDAEIVAGYGKRKVNQLLADPGIVRNRLKIDSTIRNAGAFLAVREEFGSFDAYIWGFVGGRAKVNARRSTDEVPARTPESDAMRDQTAGVQLRRLTICYAFMQAAGWSTIIRWIAFVRPD